ncbi:MAG: YmaF family protein [Tissierellia bacterium]|nr:YmaF family protein [Tissierellia bacterium]
MGDFSIVKYNDRIYTIYIINHTIKIVYILRGEMIKLFERMHTHKFEGPTSYDYMHRHYYKGITSADLNVPGHTHLMMDETTFNDGHSHQIEIRTGPEVIVRDGHIHYYRGMTTVNDGHIHYFEGYTSI